jgi:hypothetical protein
MPSPAEQNRISILNGGKKSMNIAPFTSEIEVINLIRSGCRVVSELCAKLMQELSEDVWLRSIRREELEQNWVENYVAEHSEEKLGDLRVVLQETGVQGSVEDPLAKVISTKLDSLICVSAILQKSELMLQRD